MSDELLTSVLRDVSRSFYLTMRILPGAIRPQISLAYLLARATDTIADTELIPVTARLQALSSLRDRILGTSVTVLDFGPLQEAAGIAAEKKLLQRIEDILRMLAEFSEYDRSQIREVLRTIISGQELDLQRFGEVPAGELAALESHAQLDDYTYRVAGCVGEFWTRLCRHHLFPNARLDDDLLIKNGVCLGKGLQWVNILRDIPRDLRLGRCYMPRQSLAEIGLQPHDLLSPETMSRFRPLYQQYLGEAEAHLAAGWDYVNTLPHGQFRLRLACAWPILIGVRTLRLLRVGNVLDSTRRIRVSRSDIYALMGKSILVSPWSRAWRKQMKQDANCGTICK